MEEKRTFELSKKVAREWYNQGGELRKVALQVYTEKELKQITYCDICDEIFLNEYFDLDECSQITLRKVYDIAERVCPNNATSRRQLEKLLAINMLVNVAKYLNGVHWQPDWNSSAQKKWFLRYNKYLKDIEYDFSLYRSVTNVYFATKEKALQAVEILGMDIIELALVGNW